ncbi:tubulin polymerization-promoting protein family member 2-like, partial [Corticium candelabrum]|uniref:tubulin polymerization-promoting protein family member 2-like n=1 Tax=Corticium candelabrum TaxID=121492 RepID=UPI002E267FD0
CTLFPRNADHTSQWTEQTFASSQQRTTNKRTPLLISTAMEDIFKSFCAFGSGKESTALMDNAKFAKFARDTKILDKKLTSTDVDIIFNKVKGKSERKITFDQFREALKLLAEKKYPGDADGAKKLEDFVLQGKGPTGNKTTSGVKTGGVDRLTDTSKYTGSHKQRFDESGKGKGLEGRQDFDDKAASGYVGGYKGQGTYDSKK